MVLGMEIVEPLPYVEKDLSIYNYVEDQLISIGIKENHLLVKINKVDIKPRPMGSCIRKDPKETGYSGRSSKKDLMPSGSY